MNKIANKTLRRTCMSCLPACPSIHLFVCPFAPLSVISSVRSSVLSSICLLARLSASICRLVRLSIRAFLSVFPIFTCTHANMCTYTQSHMYTFSHVRIKTKRQSHKPSLTHRKVLGKIRGQSVFSKRIRRNLVLPDEQWIDKISNILMYASLHTQTHMKRSRKKSQEPCPRGKKYESPVLPDDKKLDETKAMHLYTLHCCCSHKKVLEKFACPVLSEGPWSNWSNVVPFFSFPLSQQITTIHNSAQIWRIIFARRTTHHCVKCHHRNIIIIALPCALPPQSFCKSLTVTKPCQYQFANILSKLDSRQLDYQAVNPAVHASACSRLNVDKGQLYVAPSVVVIVWGNPHLSPHWKTYGS